MGYNKKNNDKEQKQEWPSYVKEHPIKSEWLTIGADENMVKFAEQAGKYLKDGGLTNSKIRSVYGEVKRIQMGDGVNIKPRSIC